MLKHVHPQQISAEDFAMLIVADGNNPEHCHITADDLVTKLWAGVFELWRFEDGSGVVLAEKCGERLNLVRLSGNCIAFRFKEIADTLQHRAAELNCNSIETLVYSEKLVKALERLGARQEAINMVLELKHGQE